MRAYQLHAPGPVSPESLTLTDRPRPEPGPGQLLLRVLACGVCHTDLHLVEGDLPLRKQPLTPGHQVVAVVEQTGPSVTRWKPGDRVGAPWLHRTCGECDYCRRGLENLCSSAQFTGWDVDGGYAEYLLAEADYVVPIPPEFSAAQAAPLLCAGIVGYRSLRLADLQPGERLGLFGFGASAHIAIQVARHWGCAVSVFTRSAEHQAHARALGAEWVGRAEEHPPQPLDRAILFAPRGALVPLALGWLRPGGTLAVNAIHTTPIPGFEYNLLYGERTVRSVANATRRDAEEFLPLAAQIPVKTDVQVFPLAEASQVLMRLKRSAVTGAAVLAV